MFLDNPIKQQPESRRGAPARRSQRTRKYLFPSAFQVTRLKYINYSIPALYKYKISFYLAYFIPWQLESTISNRDLRCITCLWSAKACLWFVKELYNFQIRGDRIFFLAESESEYYLSIRKFLNPNPNIIRGFKKDSNIFETLKRFEYLNIIGIIRLNLNIMWKIKSRKQELRMYIQKAQNGIM